MALIAPSLLAANFLKLEEECIVVNESEADWFHLDVMDGQFVHNISFGPMIIEFISKVAKKPCDVHLMILEPLRFAKVFKDAGADFLAIHIEACPHLHHDIQEIKALGMKPGVAINPATPVSALENILADIHHVCMMSVEPGYGGQKFIPHTIEKIKQLRKMIDEKGLKTLIEIDGGVTVENAKEIIEAGADVLVAGNTVFRAADPKGTIKKLKD
ncbi:MAG: ribulose-phosphate 3-epimerase [Chitinophagaceae bacterium]